MDFPCTSCGACCRRVYLVPQFPREWLQEDGSCIHLENNLCNIYNDRPDFCRVGNGIAMFDLPEKEYMMLTATICNMWMEEDGIKDKFIPLTLFETD